MGPLGQHAGHLGQSETDDNNFAVTQFSGSGSGHDFRCEHFRHF